METNPFHRKNRFPKIIRRRRSKTRIIRFATAFLNPTNLQQRKPRPTPLPLFRALIRLKLRHNRVPQRNNHHRFAQIEVESSRHEYKSDVFL